MKVLLNYCIIMSSLATSEINENSYLKDFAYEYKEFCPEAVYCPKNTKHTICKHDPSKPLLTPRSHCVEPVVGTTLSKNHIELLLSAVNIIRADTMNGKKTVPPAKALFEIQWNEGLALIAQIHANGCKYKRDTCRYTYNFLTPEIIMATMNFHYPNWGVMGQYLEYEPGLTHEKIVYFLQNVLKYWIVKGRQAIAGCKQFQYNGTLPPRGAMPNAGYIYLKLVSDKLTHLGCGIAGFKNSTKVKPTNTALLVCNLSNSPEPNDIVHKGGDDDDCPPGHPKINDLCSEPDLPTIPPFFTTTPVATTTAVPIRTTVPTTAAVPTTTAAPITTVVSTTPAVPTTASVPTITVIPTTAAIPTTTAVSNTTAVPTTMSDQTTTTLPPTTAVSTKTAVPTTTPVSNTTVVSTTPAVPTTAAVPTITVLPTTAAIPTTTAVSNTTAVPTTAAIPTITVLPTTAAIPTTTAVSNTTAVSTTVAFTTLTVLPTTASIPTTTAVSNTTAVSTTPAVPTTAAVPTITVLPTTAAIPTTTSVATKTAVPTTKAIPTTTDDPTTNSHSKPEILVSSVGTPEPIHCDPKSRVIYIPIVIFDDHSGRLISLFNQKLDLRFDINSEFDPIDYYRKDNQKASYTLNVKDSLHYEGTHLKAFGNKGSIVNKVKIEVPAEYIWKNYFKRNKPKTEHRYINST